jgi:hypothetical protein
MIYLIDDKKDRQQKYGWTIDMFEEYKNFIQPVWIYKEIDENNIRQGVFDEESIILFHESFFQNPINSRVSRDFTITREKLVAHAMLHPNVLLVFFSGSISSRDVKGNVIYLPVDRLYANLVCFIKEYKAGRRDIRYLLYGTNPELEEEVRQEYVIATNNIDSVGLDIPHSKNLFLQQSSIGLTLNLPLRGASEKLLSNDFSDKVFHEKIKNWLDEQQYDNLFIPLCFGKTFTDFNGLRLASLIRCTKTKNLLSNVFIYSFIKIDDYLDLFLDHECFGILKTKNIELISYSKNEFFKAANRNSEAYSISELPGQLEKLDLKPPKDHHDNHSIANEFGIYQLSYNAGIDINEITDFDKEKLNSLYFKWLIAKNGLHEALPNDIQLENNKFRSEIRLPGPKVVGFIDLKKMPKK